MSQLKIKNDEAGFVADGLVLPNFLTQKEAAKLLCKQPRWLERKRWEGGGPAFRYIGKTPVYDLKDLLDWIAKQPLLRDTAAS